MSERKKIIFFVKTKKISNLFLPFLFILTFLLIFFNKTDYYLVYKLKSAGIDVNNEDAGAIDCDFGASILPRRNQYANVKITFEGTDPPEGVVRLNNNLLNYLRI